MTTATLLGFLYGGAAYQIFHQSIQWLFQRGYFDHSPISTDWAKTIAIICCGLPTFYFIARLKDRKILRICIIWMILILLYRLFRMSGFSASYGMSLLWALIGATLVFVFIHRLLQINSEQERVLLNQLAVDTSGRLSDEFLSHFLESTLSVLPYARASIKELPETESGPASLNLIASAGAAEHVPLESIFEVPLKQPDGEVIGQLHLESNHPVKLSPLQTSTLQAFATRAAAEVSRKRADRRHRSLQDQMLQVQKLESIGLLAGGIAHDLNNILAAAHNYLSLAKESPRHNPELPDHLERVHLALNRAELLCTRLLAYAGRTERRETDCNINQLVSETVSILNAASTTQIEQTLSKSPLHVRGDAAQLSQVVLNLMTNAIDAVGNTGRGVAVRTSIQEPEPTEAAIDPALDLGPGQIVRIEIQDTGPGIDAADLSKIFDPFFSTKGKGRGLGLSAVAGIVKAHRGQIHVNSSAEGTVFLVELPLLPVTFQPEASPTPEPTIPARGRVLLVEDNQMVLESTKLVLERARMEVEVAVDAAAAMRQFEQHGDVFDTYLVDYNLEQDLGTDVIKSLREHGASGRMILMSGGGEAQFSDQDQITFIAKPFSPPELIAKLQEGRPSA